MRRTRRAQAGMTLLEMLAYTAILLVVLNLSAQILVTCMRLSSLGNRTSERTEMLQQVEEGFVRSVQSSARVVDAFGDYRSSPQALVLEAPVEQTEERCFRVLGPLDADGRLTERVFVQRNGNFELESQMTYPLHLAAVRFDYGGAPAEARRITLEVLVKPLRRDAKTGEVVQVVAAPRGVLPEGGGA